MTNKRKNWVEKLFARTPSRRSPQFEQYNSARRKLRLETLEDRSLLTAIGVSTIDSIAAEGVGSDYGSWEITRSGGQNNLICSVYFRLTGTASCGSDYSLYTADGNSISTSSYYDPDTQQYYPAAHVWIEPNASSVTIQLRPTNDAEKEQAETATIELISYNCYQESGPASGSASITINDNDSWTASVATTDGTAKEAPPSSSNFGIYAITRAGETDTTHQLYVRFQMTGTSTPSDYTLYTSSGTSISISSQWDQTTQTYIYTGGVYIPHGSFSTTVELRPNNDAERELSETAIMTLLPSTTEYGYGAYGVTGSGASITIEDNDAWIASVTTTDGVAEENPSTSPNYGTYTITRSNETDTTHQLYVRFQMTGTSTPSDYTLYTSSGTSISISSQWDQTTQTYIYTGGVYIPHGSFSTTVELRPNNDAEKELSETAIMTLLPSTTEYGYGAYGVTGSGASITIEDNDDWIVSVTTTDGVAEENPSTSPNYGTYTITRSNETDTTHPLSVRFQMTGTASNSDYTLYTSTGSSIYLSSQWDQTTQTYIYTGSVSIPSSSFSTTVELRPNNDAEREQSETAIMTLLPSTTEYGYGAYGVTGSGASITIEDNDDWIVSLGAADNTATEGLPADYGTYTITRSNETDTTHSLSVRFQMTGTATNQDYTLYTSTGSSIYLSSQWDQATQTYIYMGNVDIPSGSLSTTVELRPTNDVLREETETAIMTALPRMPEYGYGSYTVSSSSSSATVSIEDNDDWTVSVTSSDSIAAEGTPNNYGTYAITRSGETDVSTALDVQFKMTGTATNSDYALYTSSGSSIYLSSQWDPTSQSYVYSGSISIPVNSFSVTVELRPYDDSCAESDDETACMSIQPSDRYAVSSTNGSAVVTIEDNDLWKINVDSTDNVAKERLLGVAQDYGVYTFTKEYSEENVIGDNSYSITIEFDLLVYSYSCHYCATPGTDYTLSTTPLNADDTTVYLQNFSSLGMTTTQTSNGNVYRYRYQGTIPSGKSSASLRLEALFDWLDEGDYYDLDGSPEAQRGESALLTMTAVSWSSKGSWDALGSAIADEIEIKDGAILELYLDYDGDNSFDIDESITDMICFINHNDDDDNNNNLEDKLEGVGNNVPPNYAGVEGEDDLRKGRLYAWVADLEGTNNQDYKFDVFQNLPTGALEAIRLWNESDKATLFEATNQNPDRRLIGTINSACTSVSQEFWMEGIAEDINNLSANAYCYRQDGSGVYVANTNYDAAENTDIYDPYPHSPVDIDVDSDNNGYVNSVNNETRMLAEDAMEGRVGKPITYYGSTFADVPANYAYVKIINRSEQITDPNVWYSFNYTPNLEVYELTNGNYAKLNSNYKFKLSTKPLSTEYYVKAVGNNSGTGFPSGNDKVHLIFWKYDSSTTPPYTELGRDTVCFKVQDNTKASAWMIPSGWTINSNNTFTTPTPTAGAVGPKTEDSYEVNSGRYAKSSVAYPNGFELSFDLSFVGNGENGYLQPDTSGNEVIDGGDLKKLSFVGNSGVKIGGTSNVPEVAILDFCALVNQVDGVDLNSRISTLAQSLKDNLGSVKISDYTKEPLLNLMNGVRYGGRSDSVLITPALSSARTAQEYKNFLEAYYPKSQSAKGMKITLQNGFLNVYFTFENLDDYLVYSETGIANTDGYIYLQPHWGSGVKFENITIMGYPSP